MHALDRGLTWFENVVAIVSLGGAAVIAITGVVSRYIFGYIIFWSEEATIYLVICATFMGAVVTLREQEHVNVDIMPVFLKARGKLWFAVLGSVITVVYCAVVGFYAWHLLFDPAAHNTVSPALKLPLWVPLLPVPVGLTLMAVRGLQLTWLLARGEVRPPELSGTVEVETIGPDTGPDTGPAGPGPRQAGEGRG